MRSIGPAGWASHGFFGFHAQTFGNPDGATKGGGAWQGVTNQGGDGKAPGLTPRGIRDGGANPNGPNQGGGGGAPLPGVWTARVTPIPGGIFTAAASNLAGITVALDDNNKVYRSTDGTSWPASTVSIATPSETLLLAWGDGVFLAVSHTTGDVYRSTDGVTWSAAIATGLAANAIGAIGTNGAGIWAAVAGYPGPTAISDDGGVTWNVFPNTAQGAFSALLFDGSQYVGVAHQTGTNFSQICFSPDGESFTAEEITPTSEKFGPGVTFQNGVYVVLMGTSEAVRANGAAIDLINPPDIPITNFTAQPISLVSGAGVMWVFDLAGNVAGSTTGAAWSAAALNFSAGDYCAVAVHDAFNHLFIAFGGNDGSISTVAD